MGLETAHPEVLERLNKRMTLDQFRLAARFLEANGIDLRVFILRSAPVALGGGRSRVGEAVARLRLRLRRVGLLADPDPRRQRCDGGSCMPSGEFAPPSLKSLEATLEYGLDAERAACSRTSGTSRSSFAARYCSEAESIASER